MGPHVHLYPVVSFFVLAPGPNHPHRPTPRQFKRVARSLRHPDTGGGHAEPFFRRKTREWSVCGGGCVFLCGGGVVLTVCVVSAVVWHQWHHPLTTILPPSYHSLTTHLPSTHHPLTTHSPPTAPCQMDHHRHPRAMHQCDRHLPRAGDLVQLRQPFQRPLFHHVRVLPPQQPPQRSTHLPGRGGRRRRRGCQSGVEQYQHQHQHQHQYQYQYQYQQY